jgi:hypothetical protein
MYQLYCVLKDREDPPTPGEIDVASGKKQLDGHAEAQYLKKHPKILRRPLKINKQGGCN